VSHDHFDRLLAALAAPYSQNGNFLMIIDQNVLGYNRPPETKPAFFNN